jgi:tetratricopeptide (TPR) repeat protein
MKRFTIACAIFVNVVFGAAAVVRAVDDGARTLSDARDLYSAASYEDALGVLNQLRAGDHHGDEVRAIDQYRAFCLLALGRTADAEQAIEAVVAADPFFQPSDADVSPRVRTAFKDVRRRMLPGIVQDRYASAKAAFDRKDFAEAAAGFKQVLDVLADPEVGAAAGQPPLADIRTLATGFHELSASAATPPPLPTIVTAAVVPPSPPQPRVPAAPQIYGPDDVNVRPPAVIRQVLPAFEFQMLVPPSAGSVEIVIDERGMVESAMMRKSIFPRYDAQVIDATRTWAYQPALLNGVPVKYRKAVNISVKK